MIYRTCSMAIEDIEGPSNFLSHRTSLPLITHLLDCLMVCANYRPCRRDEASLARNNAIFENKILGMKVTYQHHCLCFREPIKSRCRVVRQRQHKLKITPTVLQSKGLANEQELLVFQLLCEFVL